MFADFKIVTCLFNVLSKLEYTSYGSPDMLDSVETITIESKQVRRRFFG